MTAKYPVVGGDLGVWGQELNDLIAAQFGADYVLSTNGTTVTAVPQNNANAAYSGNDGGAVLTSVLSAIGNVGTVVFQSGDYPWSTTPLIARNYASGGTENPRWLRILGNGSRIVLSNAGPSFLTLNRQADYDTFANLEVGGFIVDAANQPATGYYHALIGTIINGVQQNAQRCNYLNFYVHDNRVVNMTADNVGAGTANQRAGVWIGSSHAGAAEGTNNYILNMRFERNRFEGGNIGVIITAAYNSGGVTPGLRIYGGGWKMSDMWHSTKITPSAFFTCSNFQFGGNIASYTSLLNDATHPSSAGLVCERLYGYGSGDDGLETNGFESISVIDCVMEDSWTEGFFPSNFNYLNGVDATAQGRQQITYTRCVHRATNRLGQLQNYGWTLQGWSADTGTITLNDCKYLCPSTDLVSGTIKLAVFHQNAGSSIIRRIKINNFVASYDNVVNTGAPDGILNCFDFNGKDPTELLVDDVYITAVGNQAVGNIFVRPFRLEGGDYRADIDGVSVDHRITNVVAGTSRCVEVSPNGIAENFTVTIATPAVFTSVAHGLFINQAVVLTTTGALPTGLTAGNTYFVIAAGYTLDTFQLSSTVGGSAINTTGSQSGTHTVTRNTQIRGSIRNVKWVNVNAIDPNPTGVQVYGATTGTINGLLQIEKVDMGGVSGAAPVAFSDTTNQLKTGWVLPTNLDGTAFATSYTPNCLLGTMRILTLTNNITINAPTNAAAGAILEFLLIQDGTGGRTVTWNSGSNGFVFQVAWTNTGNTLGKKSYARFIYDGTKWQSTLNAVNTWL